MNRTRFFLQIGDAPEREVDAETWLRAERDAGFRRKPGLGEGPATGGFSHTGPDGNVRGRIEPPAA